MKMKIVFIWIDFAVELAPMKEAQLLGVLAGKTREEIIEVALQAETDGSEKIQLRYRQWASGIGWYTQKTLEIGNDQADRLIQILQKSRRQPRGLPQDAINNVVPFRKYGT